LNLLAFFPGLNIGATIEALEQKGVVEVLAEPNVMAVNGKEASFLAGGEYPYPVAQASAGGSAAVTIMFKEYGIRLNFIPTLTPRGTIRFQVAPEVSALDFTNAVEISGFDVPAITTRKSEDRSGAERRSELCGGRPAGQDTKTKPSRRSLPGRYSRPGQVLPVHATDQDQHRADRHCDTGDRLSHRCWFGPA
jgi:pilus assembly protein CpaC